MQLFETSGVAVTDRLVVSLTDDKSQFVFQTYGDRGPGSAPAPASKAASLDFFVDVPERYELGYGRWRVACTDVTVYVTLEWWSRDKITFRDANAQTVFDFLTLRLSQQAEIAPKIAKYKLQGEAELREDWVDNPDFPLTTYQRVAAEAAYESEGFALFMEQGTGKTPTAISVLMNAAIAKKGVFRALIVCPRNVRYNWAREIDKFATVPGQSVVLSGGRLDRIGQLVEVAHIEDDQYFSVVIANYEAVVSTWSGINKFRWDLAIADESDAFKSHRTTRAKTMLMLRDYCDRRLCLTGTPVNNSVADLWTQLEWLGAGLSGFQSFSKFKRFYNQYAKVSGSQKGFERFIGQQNLPYLHERLSRMSFSISKREALPDLPSRSNITVDCEMSKPQKEVYDQVAAELAAEIESELEDEPSALTVNNVLTRLLRLAQITSGYVKLDQEFEDSGQAKWEDNQLIRWFDEIPKMDALLDLIEQSDSTEKVIVWSCWVPCIHEISRRLGDIGHVKFFGGTSDKDREIAERRFNTDPTCKVFIGNPTAGGVGMNLPGYDARRPDDYDTNATKTVYYAMNWSHRDHAQSRDRNHGQGRCRLPVVYHYLLTTGTIDVTIYNRLLDKKDVANRAQDLREILETLV